VKEEETEESSQSEVVLSDRSNRKIKVNTASDFEITELRMAPQKYIHKK
jgi:hypothetical protein